MFGGGCTTEVKRAAFPCHRLLCELLCASALSCSSRVLQAKLKEHEARKSFMLGHHGTGDSVQPTEAAEQA